MQFVLLYGRPDGGAVPPPPARFRRPGFHLPPRVALPVLLLPWLAIAPSRAADAQIVGHWQVTYTYSGATTSVKNGQGGQQQWPPNGPIAPPTQTFGTGDQITVAMSGTITAVLRWVDGNGNPITDPPPPAEVYVQQSASASWTYGGEEIAANVTDEGVSISLPEGQYQTVNGPPNWSRSVSARMISKVDGSSGTILLPVTLDAHLTLACTSGFQGTATAHVTYGVIEVAPADCYDFSGYPSPPPSGSTPCAEDAATKLAGPLSDGTGYYTQGRAYTNQSVQHALEQLRKTAVFYVFGHGGAQFQSCQTFWNNNQWGYMVETEYAKQQIMNSGVPAERVVALESLPAGALNKVLLAVFEGCYTGYYNASWGSPVHGVVARGADCALGFRGSIRDPSAHTWADRFWSRLKGGQTVMQAAAGAAAGLPLIDGLGNWTTAGNPTISIHPARYGQ